MISTDGMWESIYGTSGIALAMGADTRLKNQERARMVWLASIGVANSATSPSQDAEVVYCLSAIMFKVNKGRG